MSEPPKLDYERPKKQSSVERPDVTKLDIVMWIAIGLVFAFLTVSCLLRFSFWA